MKHKTGTEPDAEFFCKFTVVFIKIGKNSFKKPQNKTKLKKQTQK